MKNNVRIILVAVFLGSLLFSCTKEDGVAKNLPLKESMNQSAMNLNDAIDAIVSSSAYDILTMNDGAQKSVAATDSMYKVYIPLDSIKGVFEYNPEAKIDRWGNSLIHFFSKTAENNQMIVSMPLEKVKNPRALRNFAPEDTLLTNNFSIAVSEYHNNYNSFWDYDYMHASEISVDNVVAGKLNIKSLISPTNGIQYASEYSFSDSYTAKYKYESGDTTVSSFTILNDDEVLYNEELLTIRNDTARFGREHQYTLTIGEVKIINKPFVHQVEVYLNGVLQSNALVEIIDKAEDSEASVCKKREIQITFDDGTTATISSLIGKSIENIKTLFDSLHQVYFAAYVIDWIAYDIYYQRK